MPVTLVCMQPTGPRLLPGAVRIARRCWVGADTAEDLLARCAAVIDTSAADSVICGPTAARLHGLWLPELPERIHVATTTPGRRGRQMTRTRRPEFCAHRYQLREGDVEQLEGVPVTSIAHTWRQLGSVLGVADLIAAGDSALRAGVHYEQLARAIASAPTSGTARCRAALPLLDARSRSRAESHLRVAICTADLPRFEVNAPIYRAEGGWLAEPDLSLQAAKIALEYQGADHAEVGRMRRDITRAGDLRREGWLVLMYGPAETFGRPWQITGDVRAALRDRAPNLLRPRTRTRC